MTSVKDAATVVNRIASIHLEVTDVRATEDMNWKRMDLIAQVNVERMRGRERQRKDRNEEEGTVNRTNADTLRRCPRVENGDIVHDVDNLFARNLNRPNRSV